MYDETSIEQPTPINRGLISHFFRQLFRDLINSRLVEGGRLSEVQLYARERGGHARVLLPRSLYS